MNGTLRRRFWLRYVKALALGAGVGGAIPVVYLLVLGRYLNVISSGWCNQVFFVLSFPADLVIAHLESTGTIERGMVSAWLPVLATYVAYWAILAAGVAMASHVSWQLLRKIRRG